MVAARSVLKSFVCLHANRLLAAGASRQGSSARGRGAGAAGPVGAADHGVQRETSVWGGRLERHLKWWKTALVLPCLPCTLRL